jgi:hypothetical protein
MMSWYLLFAGVTVVGALAGLVWLAVVVVDYLPARPVVLEPARPVRPVPAQPAAPARRWTAKEILGYRDLGGRRVQPTHPASAGAATSAEALAAWEAWGAR